MFKFLVLSSMVILVAKSASSSISSAGRMNRKGFAPFQKMEAENYSAASGAHSGLFCSNIYAVGWTYPGTYVAYYSVNFETGTQLVTFRLQGVKGDLTVGYVYLRLGSPTATPVATIPVSSTGPSGNCNYILVTSFLTTAISGVQNLYLTFDAPGGAGIAAVDWFQFTRKFV